MFLPLPVASLVDDVRFNSLVVVPGALQGLFRRRQCVVRALSMLDLDGQAIGLLQGLRRAVGPGPVWVHLLGDRALLLLDVGDIRHALKGSPEAFASDPGTKRRGMAHFQPDALTLSRGALWRNRRDFTEAVLDTQRPRHRWAARFEAVAHAETERLLATTAGDLGWEAWHAAGRRIARRILFGDAAADDEHVTDLLATLMSEANRLPSRPSAGLERLMQRLEGYVADPAPECLVARFASTPADAATAATGQLPHWMFALADTLPMNTFRALGLLATHPMQGTRAREEIAAGDQLPYVAAALEEAMRLWPTTPLLARETLEETEWDGVSVAAGTQVVISNTFNHRDRETHDFADDFAPEVWNAGRARGDWTLNHFSNGPQGCPGASLALLVGARVLATALTAGELRLRGSALGPSRPLPRTLDVFRMRFAVSAL